jgi:hypothetical protein
VKVAGASTPPPSHHVTNLRSPIGGKSISQQTPPKATDIYVMASQCKRMSTSMTLMQPQETNTKHALHRIVCYARTSFLSVCGDFAYQVCAIFYSQFCNCVHGQLFDFI